jgi:CHASE3 domain sensor protein
MESVVVNDKNVHQVVQAMVENVKSNQHRLDEVEPMLRKMATQVDNLEGLMVRNGFAAAVKDNARELKQFREEFHDFRLYRAESCPTAKKLEEENRKKAEERKWAVTLTRLGIAALALIPTLILIVDRI